MPLITENVVDQRIVKFIHRHHIFTLATGAPDAIWCSTCFYVYIDELNLFVFTTSIDTLHGKQMLENSWVAGSIALETKIIGKIIGIQFKGEAKIIEGDLLHRARQAYLLKFPVAVFMDTLLWGISPCKIKMTDNRFGFGNKLIWNKMSENGAITGN